MVKPGGNDSFVISASPGNHAQATVQFAMSGDAQQGIDYTISPSGSVTIPANQSSATVSFHATATPAGSNKKHKSKTATLTLQKGSGYKLGSPKNASITIESQ